MKTQHLETVKWLYFVKGQHLHFQGRLSCPGTTSLPIHNEMYLVERPVLKKIKKTGVLHFSSRVIPFWKEILLFVLGRSLDTVMARKLYWLYSPNSLKYIERVFLTDETSKPRNLTEI